MWLHWQDHIDKGVPLTAIEIEWYIRKGWVNEKGMLAKEGEILAEQRQLFKARHTSKQEAYKQFLLKELKTHSKTGDYMIRIYRQARRSQTSYRRLSEYTGLSELWFRIHMNASKELIAQCKRILKIENKYKQRLALRRFFYEQNVQHKVSYALLGHMTGYNERTVKDIVLEEKEKHNDK